MLNNRASANNILFGVRIIMQRLLVVCGNIVLRLKGKG